MSDRELNLRIFGFLYFPIQFWAVWVLYFGFFTIQPSLGQIYEAFGLGRIMRAVLQFVAILPLKAFTATKLIYFLLSLVPSLLRIALSTYRFWLFLFAAVQLVTFVRAQVSVLVRNAATVNEAACVIVKIGGPGSGKSSSAGYDAVLRARKMWQKLRYLYWQASGKVDKWRAEGNLEKLQEWYEIRDAYEFYISTDCVPCLWSNIPLADLYGEKANELRVEHLYQRLRLPAFSVLYIDEIGSMVDVELYREKPLDLSAMFRFCRHFGNFQIIATEQSAENIYIDARRVVAFNEYMLDQTWVCKPYLFLVVYTLLQKLFTAIQRGSRVFGPFMRLLNDIIRHIGFRRYRYCYEANTEREQSSRDGRKHVFFLPSALNYFYDERTYRNYYKAKDYALEARVYGSMILQEESDAGVRYLRMQEAEAAEKQQAMEEAARLSAELMDDEDTAAAALSLMKEADNRRKLAEKAAADPWLADRLDELRKR